MTGPHDQIYLAKWSPYRPTLPVILLKHHAEQLQIHHRILRRRSDRLAAHQTRIELLQLRRVRILVAAQHLPLLRLAVLVHLLDNDPDRELLDGGRVVLDADGLVLAVDGEVGVEAGHGVDAGLEGHGVRVAVPVAVAEDGGVEGLVGHDADDGVREAERLAHQGEVVAAQGAEEAAECDAWLGEFLSDEGFLEVAEDLSIVLGETC